jgi:hypothetical protein
MSIIRAREKFLRLQIKQAYLLADYYHALNDPTSAEAFEAWAWEAEIELNLIANAGPE